MLNSTQTKQLEAWQDEFGGFPGDIKAHALKTLEECIELCVATGCTKEQIDKSVDRELVKAERKGELTGETANPYVIGEEAADTLICLWAFIYHFNVPYKKAIDNKIPVLMSRKWKPNELTGVLERPRDD